MMRSGGPSSQTNHDDPAQRRVPVLGADNDASCCVGAPYYQAITFNNALSRYAILQDRASPPALCQGWCWPPPWRSPHSVPFDPRLGATLQPSVSATVFIWQRDLSSHCRRDPHRWKQSIDKSRRGFRAWPVCLGGQHPEAGHGRQERPRTAG